LFASDEIKQLLTANGLTDLDAAFRLGEPLDELHESRGTRHQFKRVVRLQLEGPSGPATVYMKRQWGRDRSLPRLTDLRHRTAVKSSPVHEWHGLRTLQNAGFNVSEPLALFWRGWGFSHAAVVTRAVPPPVSIADMLVSGEFARMNSAQRDALMNAAMDVVVRLERARISWRSMKTKHFYPEEIAPSQWRMWLLDCEGVCFPCTRRDSEREWRSFMRFIRKDAPTFENMFLEAYRRAQPAAAERSTVPAPLARLAAPIIGFIEELRVQAEWLRR
jgi:hypothetical protein